MHNLPVTTTSIRSSSVSYLTYTSIRPFIATDEYASIAIDNKFKTKICKMPQREPFNFDFDKEHGQKLIEAVQLNIGCFCCNKPDPDKTCSRCQVSMYCNQECQKTDWKKSGINAGHHKQLCKTYCEHRAEQDGVMGPLPICLYEIHLIDEAMLLHSMRQRRDLFLQELHKYQQQQGEIINLFVQLSVIQILDDKISLSAALSFMVDSKKRTVSTVFLETVDEGPVAEQRLQCRHGGPGVISAAAEKKVLEHWVAYIGRLRNECSADINSITFGRGLMHVADKSSFQASVEAANGGEIIWVPNRHYSLYLLQNPPR
jgi:hypothetical protein